MVPEEDSKRPGIYLIYRDIILTDLVCTSADTMGLFRFPGASPEKYFRRPRQIICVRGYVLTSGVRVIPG